METRLYIHISVLVTLTLSVFNVTERYVGQSALFHISSYKVHVIYRYTNGWLGDCAVILLTLYGWFLGFPQIYLWFHVSIFAFSNLLL